jgi:hypothetical protein
MFVLLLQRRNMRNWEWGKGLRLCTLFNGLMSPCMFEIRMACVWTFLYLMSFPFGCLCSAMPTPRQEEWVDCWCCSLYSMSLKLSQTLLRVFIFVLLSTVLPANCGFALKVWLFPIVIDIVCCSHNCKGVWCHLWTCCVLQWLHDHCLQFMMLWSALVLTWCTWFCSLYIITYKVQYGVI